MGNRAKVMDRWYGREKGYGWREPKKPREPFLGRPQFTFDDLYITPFTHERTTDQYGNVVYYPLPEKNLAPSGVAVMDDYLPHLYRGEADIAVRSGMGTRNNMYSIYEREFDQSPTERRDAIRQKGDLGRFAIR